MIYLINVDGETVCTANNLSDAVLAAAGYDGWGALYRRDDDGRMRLYSSRFHIGNNIYIPRDSDAFFDVSGLLDDDDAMLDVATQIYKRGVFHSRYSNIDIRPEGERDVD